MEDLKTTAKLVKAILEDNVQARNSDSYLYLKVLDYIADQNNIVLAAMPVPYFLTNMNDLPFPGFETVRRTRQKVQAAFPELAASDKVADMRKENEAIFKAYALSGDDYV